MIFNRVREELLPHIRNRITEDTWWPPVPLNTWATITEDTWRLPTTLNGKKSETYKKNKFIAGELLNRKENKMAKMNKFIESKLEELVSITDEATLKEEKIVREIAEELYGLIAPRGNIECYEEMVRIEESMEKYAKTIKAIRNKLAEKSGIILSIKYIVTKAFSDMLDSEFFNVPAQPTTEIDKK